MKPPKVFVLKNGLRTAILKNNSADSVTLHLKGLAGSNFEKVGANVGVAHFTEHLSLYSSVKYTNPKDFHGLVTKKGGRIYGVTSRSDVLFSVKVLKEELESGLEFLAEAFFNPNINEKTFADTQKVVISEIKRDETNISAILHNNTYSMLFDDERLKYPNIGRVENIEKLRLRDVVDFRETYYTPQNFVLILSGNMKSAHAKKLVKKYFGKRVSQTDFENIELREKTGSQTKKVFVKHLDQSHVRIDYLGYKTSNENKYAAIILAKVLSITMKNTMGAGVTANCAHFCSSQFGLFNLHIFGRIDNAEAIAALVESKINKLKTGPALGYLEYIKNQVVAGLLFKLEKNSARADYYSDVILHGAAHQNHIYDINKLRNVTREDVISVAAEIFKQEPKITILSLDTQK